MNVLVCVCPPSVPQQERRAGGVGHPPPPHQLRGSSSEVPSGHSQEDRGGEAHTHTSAASGKNSPTAPKARDAFSNLFKRNCQVGFGPRVIETRSLAGF